MVRPLPMIDPNRFASGGSSCRGAIRRVIAVGRRARHCMAAAIAVELALLAPVLLAMMVAVTDFGMAIYDQMQLTNAARSAVQYAVQSESNLADSDAIEAVARAAGRLDDAKIFVTTTQFCSCSDDGTNITCGETCTSGDEPGEYVRVSIEEEFDLLFSYPGIDNPMELSSEVTMRFR